MKYEGNFISGVMEGIGCLEYANGTKYKGEWEEGLFNGKGELTTHFSVFNGTFLDGLREGFGRWQHGSAYFSGS